MLGVIGGQLDRFSAFSPKGVEALKQVRVGSLALDWNEQPVAEVTLHLDNPEGRADLASFANMALGMATTMGGRGMDQSMRQALQGLKAETSDQGVTMKLQIPREAAETWLAKAESR